MRAGWKECGALRVAACTLVALAVAGPAAGGPLFDGLDLHLAVTGGLELLGYQEHLDPTTADSVLASCTVNGQPSTCFIDSDATVRNLLIDLNARADFRFGLIVGGMVRVEGDRGIDRERWTVAVNQGGSRGGTSTFQTDDLDYRWYRFDLYGGYRLWSALSPVAGVRWSRAEQVRNRFEPQPQGIDEAIEPIDSTWFLLGALGELARPSLSFDYVLRVAFPLAVETTNSAIAGARFTGVGGYAIEGGGSVSVPLSPIWQLRAGVEGGAMHWNGSDIETLAGGTIAKWPENDTQSLLVTAGIELVL